VFTSLPAIVLHKKFVEGRYNRTPWFGRTTRDFSNKTNELQTVTFERLRSLFFKIRIETKEKKNNFCDETQLKQKERKLVGTYLDGDLSPPS
jgi:hypothetical protein